jgi:hypothetical protein
MAQDLMRRLWSLASSLKRIASFGLLWLLTLATAALLAVWSWGMLYGLASNRPFEFRHPSGSRRYYFGVGTTQLHFVRIIGYPNGRPPAGETGIVSMGRMLSEDSFYLAEWSHDYRDAYYSANSADRYDAERPEQLAGWRRVIEMDRKVIFVSFWPIVGMLALVPAVVWIRAAGRAWGRRRRFYLTHCRRCGYDLRATPDRCPECGEVPEATRRSAA